MTPAERRRSVKAMQGGIGTCRQSSIHLIVLIEWVLPFFVVKRAEWRGKKKIEIGREGAMNLKTVKSDKAKYGFSAIETKRVATLTFTQ